MPLDISIKSNRKHHKTVLYGKSNKNMVGRLFGRFFIVFGQFLTKTSGHPVINLPMSILVEKAVFYSKYFGKYF